MICIITKGFVLKEIWSTYFPLLFLKGNLISRKFSFIHWNGPGPGFLLWKWFVFDILFFKFNCRCILEQCKLSFCYESLQNLCKQIVSKAIPIISMYKCTNYFTRNTAFSVAISDRHSLKRFCNPIYDFSWLNSRCIWMLCRVALWTQMVKQRIDSEV